MRTRSPPSPTSTTRTSWPPRSRARSSACTHVVARLYNPRARAHLPAARPRLRVRHDARRRERCSTRSRPATGTTSTAIGDVEIIEFKAVGASDGQAGAGRRDRAPVQDRRRRRAGTTTFIPERRHRARSRATSSSAPSRTRRSPRSNATWRSEPCTSSSTAAARSPATSRARCSSAGTTSRSSRSARRSSSKLVDRAARRSRSSSSATAATRASRRTPGSARADVFAAVTGDDDDNLVSCQLAKVAFGVPRAVARVNNPKNEHIFNALGIEAISSTTIISRMIEEEATIGDIRTLTSLRKGNMADRRDRAAHRPLRGVRQAGRSTSSCRSTACWSRSSAARTSSPSTATPSCSPGDVVIAFTNVAARARAQEGADGGVGEWPTARATSASLPRASTGALRRSASSTESALHPRAHGRSRS